jgi:hypothetical protein
MSGPASAIRRAAGLRARSHAGQVLTVNTPRKLVDPINAAIQ